MTETTSADALAAAAETDVSLGRRIGIAASTGAVAKGLGLVAQIVAVAIAVRTLGTDGFALYVVIASLVSWIGLAGFGIAPGLTLGITRAVARGDSGEETQLFSTALALMAAIAGLIAALASVLYATGVLGQVAATWLDAAPSEAAAALLLMILLIAAQLVVVVPEAAQLGLHSQHVSNVWAGVGSAVAIALMITTGSSATSVAGFILISQAPQLAARAINGVSFILGRRHVLRLSGLRVRAHARMIIASGVAFAGFGVASYVGLQVGLLIMAATTDADAVALGGVIVRGLTLQAAPILLLTTPAWPAVAHATARGDLGWVRKTHRRLVLLCVGYSVVTGAAILFGLQDLIAFWTGTRPPDSPALNLLLALYVVARAWSHVSATSLVGLGALRYTAIVLLVEALVVVALQLVLVPLAGVPGYAAALTVGAVGFSGWLLALRVRRELRRAG